MPTALITHPDCLGHANPPGAPEQVARLDYILRALDGLDLMELAAPMARREDLLRVHDAAYVDSVPGMMPETGHAWLDADTYVSPGSLDAIYRAAGGPVRAVDAILDGEVHNAFCALRPPGHHAEQARPMGFCIFGNVAVAAAYALEARGLARVAVLDFDVHHGNGTQALLEDDPRVLFVSSHQSPLWPGSGMAHETGPHGTVINIPVPPGTDGRAMMREWDPVWDRLRAHAPEMIFISAGFDAHIADPLANLALQTADFGRITARICELATELCEGRVVSVLEGGYDLDALAASARAHVDELMKAAG